MKLNLKIIIQSIKTKNKIRAIIIVHVFGNVASVEKLISICKKILELLRTPRKSW